MKKFYSFILFITAIFFFASCMTPKPFTHNFNEEQKKGRDKGSDVFVIKKDGEKVTGKRLNYSHNYACQAKSEEWIAVDGNKIKYGQYETKQTFQAYQILYHPIEKNKYPYGLYAKRLRFGRIDLYEYEPVTISESSNKKVPYREYIFQKDKGKAELLNYKNFTDAISDNKVILERFKQLFPSGTISIADVKTTLYNLTDIVETYNKTGMGAPNASR